MKDYFLAGITAILFACAVGRVVNKTLAPKPIPVPPPRRVCIHSEIEEIPYEDQGVVTMVWGPHCVEWVDVQPGE